MIENMSANKDEQERREAALAALGGEVEAGAREVTGREIRQMLSVRIDPELIAGLREVADIRGVKVSDLLRDAAARLVEDYRKQRIVLRTRPSTIGVQVMPKIVVQYGYNDHSFTNAASFSGQQSA